MATLVLANSFLLAPVWILHGGPRPHVLAIEAALIVGLFLLAPRSRWTTLAAGLGGALVVLLAVVQLGDTTARMSLGRPLNLYLDLRLLSAVANLLRGATGAVAGTLVLVLGSAMAVGCAVLLSRALASLRPEAGDRRQMATGAVVLGFALLAVPIRSAHPQGMGLALPAVALAREQATRFREMLEESERFAEEMRAAPSTYEDVPGLLAELEGRDVVLAFIESYGSSALDDPRYAPVVRPRLDAMAERLDGSGLGIVSGSLVAPSQGGMSWLGHGSLLSGLWLENQLRYDLLMASDRRTLVDDFEAAGYRTVALMPAITLAWPEGGRLGYDRIYARADIDYRGPPLNWVTMPDQFTWSFLEETVRGGPRPLFAELGLISSHAPWTPILPVLDDWERIGDGAVFDPYANAGESPEALWQDTDRVREHYALAVGYAIDVLASYASRYVDDGTLLIALGDHQPAPLITGEDASRTVPVHVIATDPGLLRPFLTWGFVPGAVPPRGEPLRMDAFRSWFVHAYSTTATDPRP